MFDFIKNLLQVWRRRRRLSYGWFEVVLIGRFKVYGRQTVLLPPEARGRLVIRYDRRLYRNYKYVDDMPFYKEVR